MAVLLERPFTWTMSPLLVRSHHLFNYSVIQVSKARHQHPLIGRCGVRLHVLAVVTEDKLLLLIVIPVLVTTALRIIAIVAMIS